MHIMKAIKVAAGDASRTDGLRAIRRFEKINGCAFNPKDKRHVAMLRNCGEDERFFRRLRRLKPNVKEQD